MGRTKSKFVFVTMFIVMMMFAAGGAWAGEDPGIPHPLYVNVQNGSSISPATGDLTFEAWLTKAPASVLTESSPLGGRPRIQSLANNLFGNKYQISSNHFMKSHCPQQKSPSGY